MPDLLLELFSEEIPARMQRQAAEDLKRLVTNALVERGLTYEGASAYATPRRLALQIVGLPGRQPDLREERKGPRVGETVEGIARAHKPYGVFIDLPSYGSRTSGLLPLEEAGVSKPADLAERFPAGEKLKVLVQQIDERGRIRLAIPSSASGKGLANLGSRGVSKAMADALRKALEQDGTEKKE